MPDLSIIIPVYNAQDLIRENIEGLLSVCDAAHLNAEILLCDDHSRDNSLHVMKSLAAQYPALRIFANDRNYGLGYTLRRLIPESRAEHIVYCDADLPFGAQGVVAVADVLQQADIVVASRYAGEKNYVHIFRSILSRMYWLICRIFFGLAVNDIGSGTVGFQKSEILPLNLQSNGFDIHLELYARARRKGLAIKELGLPSQLTKTGSFSVVKHAPLIIKDTLKWWWKLKVNH